MATMPPPIAEVLREAPLAEIEATLVPFLAVLKNGDGAAPASRLELDRARPGREDRVVATEAGAVSRPEAGAALAHDDLATADLLAREDLDPKHVGVGFTTVAAGAESLLMSHRPNPF